MTLTRVADLDPYRTAEIGEYLRAQTVTISELAALGAEPGDAEPLLSLIQVEYDEDTLNEGLLRLLDTLLLIAGNATLQAAADHVRPEIHRYLLAFPSVEFTPLCAASFSGRVLSLHDAVAASAPGLAQRMAARIYLP
jgi:hypothetical protein